MPQGVFDFVKNVPPHDVTLISPTANLLAIDGLHPALAFLLMRAASEVHGGAGLLHKAGDFPAPLNPVRFLLVNDVYTTGATAHAAAAALRTRVEVVTFARVVRSPRLG